MADAAAVAQVRKPERESKFQTASSAASMKVASPPPERVFEANQMARAFNLLRSNALIWSRIVHHYLMDEPEKLNDIAAWSTDATRLPYRMHNEYLRRFYLPNDLAEGRFTVDGRSIALQDIRTPIFAVGTEWDHVAPWRSSIRSTISRALM